MHGANAQPKVATRDQTTRPIVRAPTFIEALTILAPLPRAHGRLSIESAVLAASLVVVAALLVVQGPASASAASPLDVEFYRTRVQPILFAVPVGQVPKRNATALLQTR